MTTHTRNEARMQELARQVEALRTAKNGMQVDYTLSCLKKMDEQQLLSHFIDARRAALWQCIHGNLKHRQANMEIVVIYELVVCALVPRDMRLAIYHNKFCDCTELIYRGECADGRVIYVNIDLIEDEEYIPADKLFRAAFWLESIGDGELVWIAAKCQECGCEFRPQDGCVSDGPNLHYSYCLECYCAPEPSPEPSEASRHQFLEDTVDDAEYNAYLEHIHTPTASEY